VLLLRCNAELVLKKNNIQVLKMDKKNIKTVYDKYVKMVIRAKST
jgi:hypothetical protein